jgi:hypothetical protein
MKSLIETIAKALVDQIAKRKPLVLVLLSHRYHETQVGLH